MYTYTYLYLYLYTYVYAYMHTDIQTDMAACCTKSYNDWPHRQIGTQDKALMV